MNDIHTTAQWFLNKYLREQTMPLAEEIFEGCGPNVVLRRSTTPAFFAGFRRDGKDVWAHEERFAKQIPESLAMKYMYQIGSDEVYPIWGTQILD